MTPTGEGRMTILLVDDDLAIRKAFTDWLKGEGHEVVEARDGQAALECLEVGLAPDLLITDQQMPRMSGIELIPRALAIRPMMRCILMSGNLTPERVSEAKRLGAVAAVNKDVGAISAVIRQRSGS